MSDDIVVIAEMSVSLACRGFRAGPGSGCDVMLLNMKEKMRVRSKERKPLPCTAPLISSAPIMTGGAPRL